MVRLLLLTLSVFALAGLSGAQAPRAELLMGVTLRGTVSLPDGSPAIRADVNVQSMCKGGLGILGKNLQTDETGSFSIPSFSPDCPDYVFKASLRREMWLQTGSDVFYVRPNGTTPTAHIEGGVAPEPVTIRLDAKGGEAEFRVLDKETGSYIRAGITLKRRGPERRVTGWLLTEVGPGDSGNVHLLPEGKYRVEIRRYNCSRKNTWPAKETRVDFVVTAGERRRVVVVLDTRSKCPPTIIPTRPEAGRN